MTYDPTDPTDILARTVWGEARGQGRAGMEAVAATIANRVHNPRWWGNGWLSVCRKPYQFSCWNPDDPNLPKMLKVDGTDAAFVTALAVADEAINGRLADPTGGADSYFDLSISAPSWATADKFTVQIGDMRFYRIELPARDAVPADADDLNAAELNNLND